MPQALGYLLFGSASNISFLGVGLTTATGALTGAGLAVSLGANLLLSTALSSSPSTPKPQDVLQNFQENVAARQVHMGKGKIGGAMMFPPQPYNNKIHILLAQMHGKIGGRTKHYLDGVEVTLWQESSPPYVTPAGPEGGWVAEDQYQYEGRSMVQILFRDGSAPAAPYTELYPVINGWSSNHRLDGIATALIIAEAPVRNEFGAMYPNRIPAYTCEGDWKEVLDPRTGVTASTQNPIAHLRDYLLSPDGLGWDETQFIPETIVEAMNDCDDAMATSGGIQPRYRINGTYTLIQPPQDVIKSILATCDGEMYRSADGRYGFRVGKAITATVSLDAKHLHSVLNWRNGRSLLDGYTTLKSTYTDESLGFVAETIDPWVDADLVTRYRQDIVGPDPNFTFVPDHVQARYLSKIKTKKDNPIAEGVLRYDLHGLKAIGQDFINIDLDIGIPGFDYSGPVKIKSIKLAGGGLGREDSLSYVDIAVSVIDADTYSRSTAEEGRAPVPALGTGPQGFPAVTSFAVTPYGVAVAAMAAAWDAPASSSLNARIEYRITGTEDWSVAPVSDGATTAKITGVVDGSSYDVAHSWESAAGTFSDRTIISGVVPDQVGVFTTATRPRDLSVTDLTGGEAEVTVTAPDSAGHWKTNIYRDGDLIASLRSDRAEVLTFTDPSGAGAFAYTAQGVSIVKTLSVVEATTPPITNIT